MLKTPTLLTAILLCNAGYASAQWLLQSSGTEAEFRGISPASDSVVWAAGRDGTYARTIDGGATWRADTVPGATSLFFIDVHAVDDSVAYLLGTSFEGGLARIYKTMDGGAHWTESYSTNVAGVFFDGMAFWDSERGVAFSDPVEGSFLIITTADGGATWETVPPENIPPPLGGEAGFAASGTAIAIGANGRVWIGTGGGGIARVLISEDWGRSWTVTATPLPASESSGIFGVAFRDSQVGVAVGGDYQAPTDSSLNILQTLDGGQTWTLVSRSQPHGVRYGVTYVRAGDTWLLVAVGPSGWGYSADDGVTWSYIDSLGYNTAGASPGGPVWAAGQDGRIAKFRPSAR
jgi:photosystem II stability/assembly factor-like uncharacterized protein